MSEFVCTRRGDRSIVMLPNVVAIWEVMLAALKMGTIVVPAAKLLTETDLRDRLERRKSKHVIAHFSCTPRFAAVEGAYTRRACERNPIDAPGGPEISRIWLHTPPISSPAHGVRSGSAGTPLVGPRR